MSSIKSAQKRRRDNDEVRLYYDHYARQLQNHGKIISYNSFGFGDQFDRRYDLSPAKKRCKPPTASLEIKNDENSITVEKQTKDTAENDGEKQTKDTENEEEICEECNQIIPDLCDKCEQYILEVNDEIEKCGSCEQELNRASDKKSTSGTILNDGSFRPNCEICKRPCVTCPKCDKEFELDEDPDNSEEEDEDNIDSNEKQSKQSGEGMKKRKDRFSHLKDNF